MGDVIQTSPLVRALRRKHPGAHITVMVRKMGRVPAERMAEADDVWVYEEDDIYRHLVSDDGDQFLQAYRAAEAYVYKIRDGKFDNVYNCTHTAASAMLIRAAGVPEVVGADYTSDWRFVLRGPWPNFFFAAVYAREYTPFNLCDTNQHFLPERMDPVGLSFSIDETDRKEARDVLQAAGINPAERYICMQIGASDDNKRWSEARYAALAQTISAKYNARIALVGVDSEAIYGERFDRFAPGLAVSLFGKTSLTALAAVLEGADLLVSNDTGTMHVAAAVGCPVVLVSVGYVYYRETGPYLPGCVAVEKRQREMIHEGWSARSTPESQQPEPQHVAHAVDIAMELKRGAAPARIADSPAWKDIYIHTSAWGPDQCLEWYPLIERNPSETDVMRVAYRAMWIEHLDGEPHPNETEAIQRYMDHWPDDADIAKVVEHSVPLFKELAARAQEGIAATEELLNLISTPGNYSAARPLVAGLSRIDEAIRILGDVHRHLKPLTTAVRFKRDNLEGADPMVLAQSTMAIYRELESQCACMCEKLKRIAEFSTGKST